MRKFLKSAGLPIGVFALAIGSAFATNAMKNVDPNEREGYYLDENAPVVCMNSEQNCSVINSGILCTWTDENDPLEKEHALFELEGTTCSKPLYQRQ
ncbi:MULTISPECIES: DUF6520 family protein [unclassified Myroides]|uniref:DUF6520 family protein n=1 Tax=unclassified Myroides TaxID=2642485 RepID=UPI0031010003